MIRDEGFDRGGDRGIGHVGVHCRRRQVSGHDRFSCETLRQTTNRSTSTHNLIALFTISRCILTVVDRIRFYKIIMGWEGHRSTNS